MSGDPSTMYTEGSCISPDFSHETNHTYAAMIKLRSRESVRMLAQVTFDAQTHMYVHVHEFACVCLHVRV